MGNNGNWHSKALMELSKKLLENGYEVYSEYLTPELNPIELNGKVLGKTPGKLGMSLFLDFKSNDTKLSKPDIVIIKNNKVQHIIEIEEEKNPKKIAGIIVATRVAKTCDINCNIFENLLSIDGAVLHIVLKKSLTDNVQAVIDNLNADKGNLKDINILRYDEFVNNLTKYI